MTRSVAKPTVVLVSPPPPLPLAPLLPAAPLLLLLPPGLPLPVDPASAPGEPELPLVPLLPAPALPDEDPPLLGAGEPLLPFETPDEPMLPELLLDPPAPAPTPPLELGVPPFPPAADEDDEPWFPFPPPLLVPEFVSPDGPEPVDCPPLQFQILAPASPTRMVPNAVRAHPMCVFI
jgi:hypothetical protein